MESDLTPRSVGAETNQQRKTLIIDQRTASEKPPLCDVTASGSDGASPQMPVVVGGLMGGSGGFKALNGTNDTTAERGAEKKGDATLLVQSLPTTSCLTLREVYHL